MVGSIIHSSKKKYPCPNCHKEVTPIKFHTKTLEEVQGTFHRNAILMGCPDCYFAFWDYQ